MSLEELSREDLMRAVTEGVRQAFAAVLDIDVDVAGAIRGGAKDALDKVFGEQILGAIADGTREALQSGRSD